MWGHNRIGGHNRFLTFPFEKCYLICQKTYHATVVYLGELFGQNSNFRLLNFIILVTHNESVHTDHVRCTASISITRHI